MSRIPESNFELARAVGEMLLTSRRKVSTVESCTGGGIAYTLTAVAGSSAWFETGFVSYSNDAKTTLVGVPGILLAEYGAVSEPVAEAMATGAVNVTGADFAVSVTGIAGPNGGSEGKPVGMVCFGWATKGDSVKVKTRTFSGDRDDVRSQSIAFSLSGLKDILELSSSG